MLFRSFAGEPTNTYATTGRHELDDFSFVDDEWLRDYHRGGRSWLMIVSFPSRVTSPSDTRDHGCLIMRHDVGALAAGRLMAGWLAFSPRGRPIWWDRPPRLFSFLTATHRGRDMILARIVTLPKQGGTYRTSRAESGGEIRQHESDDRPQYLWPRLFAVVLQLHL